MKFLISSFFYLSFFLNCSAQKAALSNTDGFLADFYVQFNSVCCGPTSSRPLQNYVNSFQLKEGVEFSAIYFLQPLGKEGEYALIFNTDEWSENQKEKFYDGLKKIQWIKEEEQNFGGVSIRKNEKIDLKNYYSNATLKQISLIDFLSY